VQGGKLIETQNLEVTEEEGILLDWTNCCQICGQTDGCTAWDFSVETMNCQLFSAFESMDNAYTGTTPPLWYAGTPGYDDKPVECWFRNQYETCVDNYITIYRWAIRLTAIGLLCLLLRWCWTMIYGKVLCCTDDVTPGYTRPITKRSSSKHGTRYYKVTAYSALLVYKFDGHVYSKTVWMENKAISRNVKFFFLTNATDDGKLKPLGHSMPKVNPCFALSYVILLSGFMCLFVLSLQIVATDGGRFQAKYALPGSGDKTVWTAIFLLTLLAVLSSVFAIIFTKTRGKPCKPENTYTRDNF
jgi:hypothetical protein